MVIIIGNALIGNTALPPSVTPDVHLLWDDFQGILWDDTTIIDWDG